MLIESENDQIYKGSTVNIWDATIQNYFPGVKCYLLEDPLCINHKNEKNYNLTPLHAASDLGYFRIVKYLVDHGADLEALSMNEDTPLTKACYRGHLSIAAFLLSRGANINHQNKQKETPLHLAVENNHLNIVKLLIRNNANQSLRNYENNTPLDLDKKYNTYNILKSKN